MLGKIRRYTPPEDVPITPANSVQNKDRFADVGDRPALSGTLTSFADKVKEGLLAPHRTEEKYAWQRGKRFHVIWNPLVE